MRILIAILACAAYALLWTLFPQRFNPSDPWAYSLNAWEISRGFGEFLATAPNHPFWHRLAVTAPVAGIYELFGVSLWTTNLWPLLCVFLTIAALCAALPSNRERALAVFLCVTCVGLFRQAVVLSADTVAMAMLFAGAVALYHRRAAARGGARILLPLTFVLFTFAAFLAKETAYWILPVWIYAFIADRRDANKADQAARAMWTRFHLPAVVAFAVLGAAYALFCAKVWGHPLARLISVQELTGRHTWSWQHAGAYDWFKRLALAPPKILLLEFGPATLLAAIAVRLAPRKNLFWIVYTASMILLFWFGSTAFARYEPLPAVPRMLLPALPGLIVLAATLAPEIFAAKSSRILKWGVPLVLAVPFAVYAGTWNFAPDPREQAAGLLRAEAATKARVLLLCADGRCPGQLAFYFGYAFPANIVVNTLESEAHAEETPEYDAAYLYSNRALSHELRSLYGDADFESRIDALELSPLFDDGNVRLLAVPDLRATLEALRDPAR